MPLLLAWGTSTVDRRLRARLVYQLASWGTERPSEMAALIAKLADVNDPQIVESVLRAGATTAVGTTDIPGLTALAERTYGLF